MQFHRRAIRFVLPLFLSLTALSSIASAQSLDINAPSPVSTSELSGRVLARDIGDARFTNHYYAFAANQGDLLITIESKNLNGDVDVFTAGALRPLMKFSVYSESSTPVTKSIFLRKREDLILRVEARSPNDDEGTYSIKFGGSFEPLAAPVVAEGSPTPDEAQTNAIRSGDKSVRRVTSSGARVYEPEPPPAEVAAAPTPEPTPEPSAEATPAETPAETSTKVAEKPAEKPKVPTTPRNRRRTPRRPTPTKPVSTTPAASAATETPVPPQEEIGPRLVIETSDGTLINRSMTTVRRVTVENGQVVVVGRDGKVQRIPLVDVVRMTIAP